MGFFTDAYDMFSISLPGVLPPSVSSSDTGVALVGTLIGQLFFGWLGYVIYKIYTLILGDKMGRKKVYGLLTLIIMIICALASGFSFGHTLKGVMASLCFFRFWLGFGIGGDYPLSATIMAEYANKKTRGAFIAAIFAMQGMGILFSGIISLIVSTMFDHKFPTPMYEENPALSTPPEADYVWRIVLMFGALPAALTFYGRMKMTKNRPLHSTDMCKVLNVDMEAEEEKVEKISRDNFGLFSQEFVCRHGLHLFGTTSTWFLLDIFFYSQNIFQKDVLSAIGWIPAAKTMNGINEVFRISKAQTLIALCSTVPGHWFTGFFFTTVFMFAIVIPYDHWKTNHLGFVIMYALTFLFANFGPNATTFVVPAEIPARLRSRCHGISAATGKEGAIIGAYGFLYVAQSQDKTKTDAGYPPGIGIKNALIILGCINALGMICTFAVPEPNGKSLEEASQETFGDDDDEVQGA
ncbi:hypothetical protein ABFS83_07G046300 [Erythranthe nasuta]